MMKIKKSVRIELMEIGKQIIENGATLAGIASMEALKSSSSHLIYSEFDPCADCKVYWRRVCPENAMDAKASVLESIDDSFDLPARDGAYDREICKIVVALPTGIPADNQQ